MQRRGCRDAIIDWVTWTGKNLLITDHSYGNVHVVVALGRENKRKKIERIWEKSTTKIKYKKEGKKNI